MVVIVVMVGAAIGVAGYAIATNSVPAAHNTETATAGLLTSTLSHSSTGPVNSASQGGLQTETVTVTTTVNDPGGTTTTTSCSYTTVVTVTRIVTASAQTTVTVTATATSYGSTVTRTDCINYISTTIATSTQTK